MTALQGRVLVTGGSGFVGSSVARLLLQEGFSVRALVRPTSNRSNLAGLNVETVEGDLSLPHSLPGALKGIEYLFHVAADYRLWVPDPELIYLVNVEGTRRLMEAALDAGVERIVYTSSVATLGLHADGSPSDEEVPASISDMIGHYKRSKFLAEEIVRKMCDAEGLPAVVVNPSTPVGPRDIKPTPTGRMIRDAGAGRIPAYVDTGLNVVHVDDVAMGHLLALRSGQIGRRYILGGENLSLREILARIAAISGRKPPRLCLSPGLILPVAIVSELWARCIGGADPLVTRDGLRMARKKMYFSSARAESELGYRFRPANEALEDALRWFSRN